jgi:hypothetical protein
LFFAIWKRFLMYLVKLYLETSLVEIAYLDLPAFLIYYFPALAKSSVGIATPFYQSGLKHAPRVFLWPRFACYGGSASGQLRLGRAFGRLLQPDLDPPPY